MTGQDASEKTHRIFENYLYARGISWAPVPVNQGRTPDYRLTAKESEAICEVKTIVGSGLLPSGGYDPCKRIVAKIRKARPQLHGAENEPRCLLLHSQSVYDSLEAGIVAAAAFGPGHRDYRHNYAVIDSRPPALRFSRKKELAEVHKSGYAETWCEGLSVYHNPNARIPLPPQSLPCAAHHTSLYGRILSRQPAWHPVGSTTHVIVPT